MSEDKVRLGEGLADGLKEEANQELLDIGKLFISMISKAIKEKVRNVDINKLFSKQEKDELISLWSTKLVEEGRLSKGYAGLPDDLLIENLHQDGYIDGMYAGYVLTMMSLIDNNAPKDLIISIRDELRPQLIGQHYCDRKSIYDQYKNEKYSWAETTKEE